MECAEDSAKAFERLCSVPFDLAILDIYMPSLSGLEILHKIREKNIPTDIIIITGRADVENAVQALKTGAQDFLTKPIQTDALISSVCNLLEKKRPCANILAKRLDIFMREHAYESSMNLKFLCTHFNISVCYVSQLFRQHIGAPFKSRLTHYRLQKAKTLLTTTDEPIYLIAEACGFKNWRRLDETFRRVEKITPKKYRQICIEKRTEQRASG